MNDPSQTQESRFAFFGLNILYFGWFAYLLAVSEFFFRPLLLGGATLFGIGAIIALYRLLSPIRKDVIAAIVIAAGLASIIGFVSEPTIYSGRDQGSISEAAIELANTGSLSFHAPVIETFFALYGPGKALHFPGFFYNDAGELVTQFPLGSISWFGAFFSLFGLSGLTIANGVSLALALLSLFFLIRHFSGASFALLGIALAAFSFLPMWFAKYTLSENLAFFLFSFLALNTALFIKTPDRISFANILLSGTLLAITRIEGLAILPIALALAFFSKSGQAYVRANPLRRRVLPLVAIALVLTINVSSSIPFFRTIGKAVFSDIQSISGRASSLETFSNSVSLWHTLSLYGLVSIFLIGIIGAMLLAAKRHRQELIPVLLALPTFVYLIFPAITPDHPWMLRRFLPIIFPSLLASAVISAAILFPKQSSGKMRRRLLVVTFVILFAAELPAFVLCIGETEHRELKQITNELASTIGERDLLLIDRDATGDPYAMLAGPLRFLHGKQAAYFFNPNDYHRIQKEPYEHIYLLAPTDDAEEWKSILGTPPIAVQSVAIKTTFFPPYSTENQLLPRPISIETENTLWILK